MKFFLCTVHLIFALTASNQICRRAKGHTVIAGVEQQTAKQPKITQSKARVSERWVTRQVETPTHTHELTCQLLKAQGEDIAPLAHHVKCRPAGKISDSESKRPFKKMHKQRWREKKNTRNEPQIARVQKQRYSAKRIGLKKHKQRDKNRARTHLCGSESLSCTVHSICQKSSPHFIINKMGPSYLTQK